MSDAVTGDAVPIREEVVRLKMGGSASFRKERQMFIHKIDQVLHPL